MKILLALNGKQEKTNKIGKALAAKADAEGLELTFDSVVSEVAIRNKMNDTHYDAVIVTSKLEARPFTIESLTSISEIDEDTKLIIVIPDDAGGSEYCVKLFRNNLIYGVYLEDAKIPKLYSLIKNTRTRGEAKAYYQLVLNTATEEKISRGIVPEEIRRMADYVMHGAPGEEETLEKRVNHMAQYCNEAEKEAVFASLSEEVREKVRQIPGYSKYFFDPVNAEEEREREKVNIDLSEQKDDEEPDSESEKPAKEVEPAAEVAPETKAKNIVSIDTKKAEKKESDAPKKKEPVKKDKASDDDSVIKTAERVAKKAASEAISGIKSFTGIFSKSSDKKTKTEKERPASSDPSKLISRRVIGVIGAYSGAGTTTTAVSLAKTISKYEPVTLIEVPRNGVSGIFEAYNLDKHIGPTFKSVPHMIAGDEKDLSRVSNIYEGINFFVSNNAYGYEALSNDQLALMLNGTSDNVVVDLGSSLEETCSNGIANLLTHLVLVYSSSNADKHLSKIKADISSIEAMNLVPIVICIEDKSSARAATIGSVKVIRTKSVIGSKIIPLGLSSIDKKILLETIGVSSNGKRVIVTPKREKRGVVDVAITGTRSGIGTTYTALLLADSLRKKYKVAYFEFNNSSDMQHLAGEYNSDEKGFISISGVDIYYDIDYFDFANTHRSEYDFVIIDFGTMAKMGKRRDVFSSCSTKFICIPSSPWRVCDVDYDIELIDELDPNGNIQLLAPLATKRTLKDYNLYKRCGRREIIPIPYAEEPIGCKEATEYLAKLF